MLACPFVVIDSSDVDAVDLTGVEVITYSEMQEKAAENGGVYTLTQNIRIDNSTTPNYISQDITIDGQKQYTIYGMIKLDTGNTNETSMLNVTICNLTLDGDGTSSTYGIHSQNQGEKDPSGFRTVDLTVDNCTIQNFANKGIYITNCQNLLVKNCTFKNVASSTETISSGDHAVDVVLCNVTGATIEFNNNKFVGNVGHNAAIQVQQRGGPNSGIDDNPGDIKESFTTPATIEYAWFIDNDFTESNAEADIRLGSWPSEDKGIRTYSKAFDTRIVSGGETVVASCVELGSEGLYKKNLDLQVGMADGSVLQTVGSTSDSEGTTTGVLDLYIESGSAKISGILQEFMSVDVGENATAVLDNLDNRGKIVSYNNNVSGKPVSGNPVENISTEPPVSSDDDEDLPPFIPSQSSNDDDTVTIVACAAAAAVAAILAVFLVIDRKG